MNKNDIIKKVDHTLLSTAATWDEVRQACEDAIKYNTASVCISPSFVYRAKEFVCQRMKVCTVIGFPNGYTATKVKVFETANAVSDGADEIDMVINIGALKDRDEPFIENEIRAVKKACDGRILKVIIETCLLTDEEKIMMCHAVTKAGADYIKTSTGFSNGGATFDDVRLLKAHVGSGVKIKASGGIAGFKDAEEYIRLGCSRLGTSSLVKLLKEEEG